ncbi:MAG: hypothetical protein A2156_07350 [Deltaproteobacteria bacterium RBG_16_48_10]|nr:MAG: hypothetical protein A2156_07350 [Deltaproteobacteria bacterium RBG_16_48_10]
MTDRINMKKKRGEWADLLAGLTLFFSSLLFFCDLFRGRYLLTERDLGPYFIPPRFFWVESLKRGDLPFWNPYQFSGSPFLANPQHGILYPLNSLFFFLPFDVAFNVIILSHFLLGGLFIYLLLKDLDVEPSGALLSALVFVLSGFLLSVHSLLTVLLSVTWTPLILLFFRRAIVGQGFKNEALCAVFMTLSFLGGGIEIVYGNFFVLLIMAIFYPFSNTSFVENSPRPNKFTERISNRLLKIPRCLPLPGLGRSKDLFKRFKNLFMVSILFFFFSAIQLIPFLELFSHSIRGSGISYQEATIWSFAPKDILLFFLPDAYGYFLDMKKYWATQCWFKTLYTGGLPFLLSFVYFLFGRGRRLFLALMFFSVFLALGRYNPLYPIIFKHVPFFNGIRYPAKFLYLFFLVLSVTAGLGFQRLVELSQALKQKRLRNLPILLSLISGLFLLLLVTGHQEIYNFLKGKGMDFPDFNHLSVNLYNAGRFFFYMTLFFLFIRMGIENRWKGWVKGVLIFSLIADLFGNMGFYGKEKTADYFQKTKILEKIVSDPGPYRVFSTKKTTAMDTPILLGNATPLEVTKEKHLPSMNLLHQIHDLWGIEVIRLKRVDELYRAFTETPSISSTNLIDLYGVRYVISAAPIEDPRFERIYSRLEGLQGREEDLVKQNTIKLYRYRNQVRRGWMVRNFRVMDPIATLSMLTSKKFQPARVVLLEEEPQVTGKASLAAFGQTTASMGSPSPRPLSPDSSVEIHSETNNRLRFSVHAKEDCFLVLNDTYFPGWKAYVDGREEKIYRADYAFRAVPMAAGIHQVQFVYDPMSFKLGAAITCFGILACSVTGFLIHRRKVFRG